MSDAMAILQRVSMDGNFFWFDWKTQWSSVYNITDKTVLLGPNSDYANPVEFKLE